MSDSVWYPITSVGPAEHNGLVGSLQLESAFSACETKPSIKPPFTSAAIDAAPCGPPPLLSAWSAYGVAQTPAAGSGLHTVGAPLASVGIPSAPGKVPK